MERAGRGEGDDCQPARQRPELPHSQPVRGAAVEGDRPEVGKGGSESSQIIRLVIADRRVGAAWPLRLGHDIPQADARSLQCRQSLVIIQPLQIDSSRRRQQSPELVLRIGVITLRGQRAVARQAAADEQTSVPVDNGREGSLEHRSIPWRENTALRNAA